MEILNYFLVGIHLLGFLALFGTTILQLRSDKKTVRSGMLHGAFVQMISGVALVALGGEDIDHVAAATKLLIVIIICGLLMYYRKKEGRVLPPMPYYAVLILTLCEVLIAALWISHT